MMEPAHIGTKNACSLPPFFFSRRIKSHNDKNGYVPPLRSSSLGVEISSYTVFSTKLREAVALRHSRGAIKSPGVSLAGQSENREWDLVLGLQFKALNTHNEKVFLAETSLFQVGRRDLSSCRRLHSSCLRTTLSFSDRCRPSTAVFVMAS